MSSCSSDSDDDSPVHSKESERPVSIPEGLEPTTIRDGVLCMNEKVISHFPDLKPTVQVEANGYALLEITNKVMHYHPPAGYIYRVRVVVTPTTTGYHFYGFISRHVMNSIIDLKKLIRD